MSKLFSSIAMISVVSGGVYFWKYFEHQQTQMAALESRVKTLEDKVFPPKKPVVEKPKSEPKRSSKRKDKTPS